MALERGTGPWDPASSEARFRVLFEHTADVGFVTSADGIIGYVTPSVTRSFGFSQEELIGTLGRELFEADELAELEEVSALLVEHGHKISFTTVMRNHAGERRRVDVTIQNLLDHPAVVGYVANVRDVTEQVETLRELRAARAQQRAILSRSHDLTMFFEQDGTVVWASPNCVDLFGVNADELIGTNGLDTIHPDDRDRVVGEFLGMMELGDSVRTSFRITDFTGNVRWIEEIATNLIDEPDVGFVVGNLRDVTEQQAALRALAATEARLRSILDSAQEGIWVTDHRGRTLFANPRMADILGVDGNQLAGQTLADYVVPEERPVVVANDAMSGNGEIRRFETRFIRPDDSTRSALVSSSPLPQGASAPDAAPVDILHMVTDITDRKSNEAELRRITLHDGLTGLPNRRLFTDRLAHHLEHAGRRPTALLFLNLDNFKDVNESLGHAAGDVVLSEVARRLRRAARSEDIVARSGGDEFLVLSVDLVDAEEAVIVAEQLRIALHAPIHIDDTELVVTASIGIAMTPPADAEGLIRNAGVAMYRAKEDGRDGTALFDQHNESAAQERVRIQADLRRAIANHEFEVWYQPIVGLDDAAVRGVEALVRWQHPTRGLLLPGAFMNVAESTGLIRDIGLDVLETACRDAVDWMDPAKPVRVAVNIAGLQVVDDRLCTQVAEVITRTGIDPEMLTLEVTESSALRDLEGAERNLKGLRELGVRLALDDFGTGYSSLSFLKRLPVTVVKIDQSFVAGLGERREDELIVAGVISMAHALGHVVIAEGIETTQQRDALRRLGCRYGQGFLWSRAVPVDELAAVIAGIECDRSTYLEAAFGDREARAKQLLATNGPGPGSTEHATAFDALPGASAVVDEAGVIVATNRTWRLFATMNDGNAMATGVGANYLSVCERAATQDCVEGATIAAGLRAVLAGDATDFELEYQCPSPLQDRSFLMQAVSNGGHGLVVSHTDISALKQIDDRFIVLGSDNPLAGLPDATLLDSSLEQIRDDAVAHGTSLTLLCCDVFGVAAVSAAQGEEARGQLLAQIAARLTRVLRTDDLVGRTNDERYVIACAALEAPDADAERIARRIEAVLEMPFQLGSHEVSITARVGYVVGDGSETAATLLRCASAPAA